MHKDNKELYNYTQGGTLENLIIENGLEKNQMEQLMNKLKEKEHIHEGLEREIDEIEETTSIISKKFKVNLNNNINNNFNNYNRKQNLNY